MEGLPKDVLGYARIGEREKILILLNFDAQEKEFQVEATASIFKLTPGSQRIGNIIRLDGYGALILKQQL